MDVREPSCMVIANGEDITGLLMGYTSDNQARLIRLTINDQRGYESDMLTIVLSDTDSKVAKPPKGAELDVYLGYAGESLHYKGKYIVDEIAHSGPPDQLTITAKAADMLQGLKVKRTRSWDNTTLGAIVRQIASEQNLIAAIGAEFDSVSIAHIDQVNESALHFLTRLGKQHDAIVKPAAGRLLFVKRGASTSASGAALPLTTIPRTDSSDHHYVEKGRDEYTGVRAYWHDIRKSRRNGVVIGSQVRLKTLSGTFASADLARQAAQAEYDRQLREESELSITLQHGKPELIAEIRILPQGFRSYIDREWVAAEIVHELSSDSGLSSTIRAELPNTGS